MSRASIDHWDNAQVAAFADDVSADHSLASMNRRNEMYPGLLELMPIAGFEDKIVIDFGCGPGHDTIGFLLNGAAHVYAVDSSWQGLGYTRARLRAHGFLERCTTICVSEGEWRLPQAHHIHTAGAIHHIEDPVAALRKLRYSTTKYKAEVRMMVYNADSQLVQVHGGPEGFEMIADGSAPIAKAWTQPEVRRIAYDAGFKEAEYLGGYLMGESEGPGCGGCWSLRA